MRNIRTREAIEVLVFCIANYSLKIDVGACIASNLPSNIEYQIAISSIRELISSLASCVLPSLASGLLVLGLAPGLQAKPGVWPVRRPGAGRKAHGANAIRVSDSDF